MRLVVFALMLALLAACGGEDDTQAEHVTDAEKIAPQPAPAPDFDSNAEASSGGADDAADPEALSANGWKNLRIGMTRQEVEAAYGPDANPNAVGGPEPDKCDEFRPEDAPDGFLLMVTDGKLARISLIRDASVKTGEGFGLGASAEDVKAAYGDAAMVSPHKYVEAPAQYITVWQADRSQEAYVEDPAARGLRYVIGRDGKVERIHAGGPAIQYVEGCL